MKDVASLYHLKLSALEVVFFLRSFLETILELWLRNSLSNSKFNVITISMSQLGVSGKHEPIAQPSLSELPM